MLKKDKPRIQLYNPSFESDMVLVTEDTKLIEKSPNLPEMPVTVTTPSPNLGVADRTRSALAKFKDALKDRTKLTEVEVEPPKLAQEYEEFVNEEKEIMIEEVKVVPKINGSDDLDKLVKEAELNPRSWSTSDVKRFYELNDLPGVAETLSSMKIDGNALLQLNKETLAMRVEVTATIRVMGFVRMLRQLDTAYTNKRNPKPEISTPAFTNFRIPKRRLEDEVADPTTSEKRKETLAKRLRWMADPVGYEREIARDPKPKDSFPGLGATRKKVCYKCQAEGHLGRECTQSSSGRGGRGGRGGGSYNNRSYSSPSVNSSSTLIEEDWGSDPVAKNSTQTPNRSVTADDDDWDVAPSASPKASGGEDDWGNGSVSTPVPSKPTASSTAGDDDWGDGTIIVASKPPSSTAPDDDWGDINSTVSNTSFTSTPSWNSGGGFGSDRGGRGGNRGGRGWGGDRGGRGGDRGGRGGSRACFNCNEEGHMSRECPTGRGGGGRGGRGGSRNCFKCNQEGHMSYDCKNGGGYGNKSGGFNRNYTNSSPYGEKSNTADDDWGDGASKTSQVPKRLEPVSMDDDDNWDDPPSTPSQPKVPTRTVPMAVDDNWDDQPAVSANSKPTSGDDDWGDAPKAMPPKLPLLTVNDGWDDPSASKPAPTKLLPSSGGDDDWGDGPATASTVSKLPTSNSQDDDWGDSSSTISKSSYSTPSWQNGGGRGGDRGGRGGIRGGRGWGGDRGGRGGSRACFKCNEEGHMSRECPTGGRGGGAGRGGRGGSRNCYNCNKEGHMSYDCPNGGGYGNKGGGFNRSYSGTSSYGGKPNTADDDWNDGASKSQAPKRTVPEPIDDENWDDTPTPAQSKAPTRPVPMEKQDDDWGAPPATFVEPKSSSWDDDWSDTPKVVPPKLLPSSTKNDSWDDSPASKPVSTKAPLSTFGDDDWGDGPTTTPASSKLSNSAAQDDDWGDSSSTVSKSSFSSNASWNNGGIRNDDRVSRGWSSDRGSHRGSRACFKCNQEGHMSRECPTGGGRSGDRGGGRSSERGGRSSDRGGRDGDRNDRGGSRACFKCNEEGHMSRDCPSNRNGGGGRGGRSSRNCFKCNQEGHMSYDCPSG